jgi:hypothetical protein
MDLEAHRRAYIAEVEAQGRRAAAAPAAASGEAATLGVIEAMSLPTAEFADGVRFLLDTLGDAAASTPVRLAALGKLGAAEFRPHRFGPFHAEYLDLLRKLATGRDRALRTAVLERLTLTNDRYAQKLLREGLANPRKALVPAAKAVQLLARDDHAALRPVFRDLAATGAGKVREEALRALASDTRSAALFETIAADKAESTPIRQIAAVNLKNTSAGRFAKLATKLALDPDDDDDLRAAAVSAITHTRAVADKVPRARFGKALQSVAQTTKSRALKSSIKGFAKTHGA